MAERADSILTCNPVPCPPNPGESMLDMCGPRLPPQHVQMTDNILLNSEDGHRFKKKPGTTKKDLCVILFNFF